jgi:predicted flap endonuclease-1-like 5' DNA nuclease
MSLAVSSEIANALPIILIALAVLAIAVWAFMRANRKAKVIEQPGESLKRDVLDEGAARAGRNQALIDAPPAASKTIPEPVPAPVAIQEKTPASSPARATHASEQAVSPAPSDDLTRIKGLGPKIATLLSELGITHFAQIASWNDADVERIDAQLGRFKGRIERDQWVAQAKLLAGGDEAGFTEKFGQNG